MPYYSAAEFIEEQIDKALQRYERFLEGAEKQPSSTGIAFVGKRF
jgi:hypothetical protein